METKHHSSKLDTFGYCVATTMTLFTLVITLLPLA